MLAFEDIVEMRLGNSDGPRQSSFGDLSTPNTVLQMQNEPKLSFPKVNRHGWLYSFGE